MILGVVLFFFVDVVFVVVLTFSSAVAPDAKVPIE